MQSINKETLELKAHHVFSLKNYLQKIAMDNYPSTEYLILRTFINFVYGDRMLETMDIITNKINDLEVNINVKIIKEQDQLCKTCNLETECKKENHDALMEKINLFEQEYGFRRLKHPKYDNILTNPKMQDIILENILELSAEKTYSLKELIYKIKKMEKT